MSLQSEIKMIFDGKAFMRPLFYSYEGGLRIELSEGGTFLNQFLTAHRKGLEVCRQIFEPDEEITLCIKMHGKQRLISNIDAFRELRALDLYPFSKKEHWIEPVEEEWVNESDREEYVWHHIAFNISSEFLTNALWGAFAADFGPIEPRAPGIIYLFNLKKETLVFPYDDRGMDIVGPNKGLLKKLYNQFNHYLLDYDRQEMDASFSQG